MKNIKIISLIIALVLTLSSIPFVVFAEDATTAKSATTVKDEIPYIDGVSDYFGWGYGSKTELTAKDAGIPDGYQGNYVMAFEPKGSDSKDISFVIDLRQTVCEGIKISDVKSITFRVMAAEVESFRIRTKSGTSNQVNVANSTPGAWQDVVVSGDNIAKTFVDDGEGYFAPFAFGYRNKKTATTVYFDGVTVELKEGVVPPSETETEAPTETETETETETKIETETEAPAEPETPVVPDPLYYSFADGKGKDEIPYGNKSSEGQWYGYTNFKMMDEAQAKYAGVPKGYSGWVLAIDPNNGNTSIGLDLTSYRTALIEKIIFRVWCPAGTQAADGVRLSGAATNTWSMLAAPSALGEWIEVTLEKEDYTFLDFDGDGFCDVTNFCFRGATATGYIDSITVVTKAADSTPPVITYDGETVINTSEGKPFVINVSAYDAYEDCAVTPEFIWSEGALDENGLLLAGSHTCTVKATDSFGNSSEIVLTVNVGAEDIEAPVINWTPDEIVVMKGMIPAFDIFATDSMDGRIEVQLEWSDCAFDEAGRFRFGTHTLTVTATDLSGNSTKHTVTVYVENTRPIIGTLVQDS